MRQELARHLAAQIECMMATIGETPWTSGATDCIDHLLRAKRILMAIAEGMIPAHRVP